VTLALARQPKHALTKPLGIKRLKRAVPRANQVLELKSVRGMAQAVPLLLRAALVPEEAALKERVGARLRVTPLLILILVLGTAALLVFSQVVTPEPMRLATGLVIRPRLMQTPVLRK